MSPRQQQQHMRRQSSPYAQQRENSSPWGIPQASAPDQRNGQQQSADQQHFLLMDSQAQREHDQQEHQLLQKPKTRGPGTPAARPPLKPGAPLAAGGSLAADAAEHPEEQPKGPRKVASLSSGAGTTPTSLQRERQQQQQKQQQKQRRRATRRAQVPQLSPAKKQLECPSGKARTKPATTTPPSSATTNCPKQQRGHQGVVDAGAEGLQRPGLEAPTSEALTTTIFAQQRGNQQQQQSQHLLLRQLPARLALLQQQRHSKQQQQQQQHTEQRTSQQQLQEFLQLQQRRPQQLQGQHQPLPTPTLAYGTLRKKPPTRWKKPSPFGLRVDFPVNPLLQPLLLDKSGCCCFAVSLLPVQLLLLVLMFLLQLPLQASR